MLLKHPMKKIRYAVVGLGHIAQTAVLPAFRHARRNSELVALVSGDIHKLKEIGDKYHIEKRYLYSEFEDCLRREEVDAIYITTPNSYHRNIMETAARYGIHVLCEKPMAVTTEDCISMISEAEKNNVLLMVAYRLHFQSANLRVMNLAHTRKIGDLKIFNSVFTFPIRDPHNIRLEETEKGGGPLYDIGIYCINTARRLFRSEPVEVFAMAGSSKDSKFKHVDESMSCILRFPEGKLASFSLSFGAFPSADFEIIGTKGRIRLEKGYEYKKTMTLKIYEDKKVIIKKYRRRDQFAPELLHFSDCINNKRKPEPSGEDGLTDIKIIEALLLSIDLGSPIAIDEINKKVKTAQGQKVTRPSFIRPKFFNVFSNNGTRH